MQILLKTILIISVLALFVFASKPNASNKSQNQTNILNRFKIDTTSSKIHWNCHHLGQLKFTQGSILMQNNEPIEINLSVDMTSITNSDIDNKLLKGTLENVLKSEEFFDTDNAIDDNNLYMYTFGVNYFFNDWTRLQVNYQYKAEKGAEIPNDAILVQLQVKF